MSSFWPAFRSAPFEIRLFAAFCVVVVLVDWGTLLFANELRDALAPVVGPTPSLGYTAALVMAGMLILHRGRAPRRAILFMLAIYMVYGLVHLAIALPYSGNHPQFQTTVWLPIWLLGVPLAWMAVLSTPRVRRWCE